jgi:hypothetical protein
MARPKPTPTTGKGAVISLESEPAKLHLVASGFPKAISGIEAKSTFADIQTQELLHIEIDSYPKSGTPKSDRAVKFCKIVSQIDVSFFPGQARPVIVCEARSGMNQKHGEKYSEKVYWSFTSETYLIANVESFMGAVCRDVIQHLKNDETS